MNRISKNDEELRHALRQVDGEIRLEEASEERMLTRMLDRFQEDRAQTSQRADVDGARELDLVPRAERQGLGASTWLGRAAAVALLVGGIAALVAVITGRNTDQEIPAISDTAVIPDQSTTPQSGTPATTDTAQPDSPSANALNRLGYRAFTTYQYAAVDDENQFLAGVTGRVGQMVTDVNAITTLTIRSTASAGFGADEEVATFELTALPDGSVRGPLEFIDPIQLGGRCAGAAIPLGEFIAESYAVVARCDGGTETRVQVTTTVDDPQVLPLLSEPLLATAVNYRIVIAGDEAAARTVTLWFTDEGLVRRSHEIDGMIRHLDLSVSSLVEIGDQS